MKKLLRIAAILYFTPWIRWFLIPFILFVFWIVFSLLFSSTANIFTLIKDYDTSSIIKAPSGKLLKGESIVGEFKATENNLGILSVRFNEMPYIDYDSQDSIVFRIKEKGSNTWLYQNSYKEGEIYGLPLYPFGFPRFTDSKGKTFIFSITSMYGNNTNAISISNENPVLVSKYVFTKDLLFKNKQMFLQFMYKKIINSFTNIDFLNSSITFALPFIFYLFWIGVLTRTRTDRYTFLFVSPLLIILAVLLNVDRTIGFFLALTTFWCISIITYKVESSVSYFFAFLFFVLALIMVLFGFQLIGSGLSNWTYIYLVIGTIQLFRELKKPEVKRLTYGELLDSILSVTFMQKLRRFISK